jgi:RimJ/RimL family protein N-acetyltransferase
VSHTLPDGTQLHLRPIEAADKARLSVAHGRLSEETIRRRYLAAKPRVTSSELAYLTEVDGYNHIALAAFPVDDPETLAGIARCVRLADTPETAEFAVVVADAFQGRGLGTLLARELATAARAAGIRRFAATMLSDNLAVRRVMATITAHLEVERMDGGLREVVIDLAA